MHISIQMHLYVNLLNLVECSIFRHKWFEKTPAWPVFKTAGIKKWAIQGSWREAPKGLKGCITIQKQHMQFSSGKFKIPRHFKWTKNNQFLEIMPFFSPRETIHGQNPFFGEQISLMLFAPSKNHGQSHGRSADPMRILGYIYIYIILGEPSVKKKTTSLYL